MTKSTPSPKRQYDHRLKYLIAVSRDPHLFPDLNIPYSTAMGWIKSGSEKYSNVVAEINLDQKLIQGCLENRSHSLALKKTKAQIEGLKSVLQVFHINLSEMKNIDIKSKQAVVNLISRLSDRVKIPDLLGCLNLSPGRYRSWWAQTRLCSSSDQRCSKKRPHSLSDLEIKKMTDMLQDKKLHHMSVISLMWHAKRIGKLFVSYSTWLRTALVHKSVKWCMEIATSGQESIWAASNVASQNM